MQALIDVILPVFLVIGAGYLAVWSRFFPAEAVDGLMRFAQNFAFPILLFNAIRNLDLGAAFHWPLLIAFYTGAIVAFGLGYLGARLWLKRDTEDSVAIAFGALFSNSLMLGLAITERAFGPGALEPNYAIIALHAPFCYGVGITAMEIARARTSGVRASPQKVLAAMFKNVLVIGIAAGFVFNFASIPLPGVVEDAVGMIIPTALPIALFGMGGVLVQYRPEGDTRAIAMVCALSLLVHPSVTWTLSQVFGLGTGAMRSAVLTSAMAPGINAYVFANMYGRAKRVAATSVLAATSLSLLTAWFWLSLLP
ncbi:AEC family transporter [Mesobacterium pallidum]|uniref:AEC family transporter n=1 Tax=Mesobacterium pallidum TaxID=2872037 RepID=UPI001EE30127|nr:AEC family transporter [Mesobacterium pallidum]